MVAPIRPANHSLTYRTASSLAHQSINRWFYLYSTRPYSTLLVTAIQSYSTSRSTLLTYRSPFAQSSTSPPPSSPFVHPSHRPPLMASRSSSPHRHHHNHHHHHYRGFIRFARWAIETRLDNSGLFFFPSLFLPLARPPPTVGGMIQHDRLKQKKFLINENKDKRLRRHTPSPACLHDYYFGSLFPM